MGIKVDSSMVVQIVVKQRILMLFLSICLFSCVAESTRTARSSMASQKQNCKWDAVNQMFEAPIFNLKWDLSELGDWRIANTEQLPENMIFCGALGDVSVSLIAIKKRGNVSITDGAEEFINGFLSSALAEANVFHGLDRETTHYEKCNFLFKDAIRFGTIENVRDARLGTDEPIPFLYGGYVFEKDGMVFIPLVLMPYRYVEEYGDSAMDLFFQRLSYINASQELQRK